MSSNDHCLRIVKAQILMRWARRVAVRIPVCPDRTIRLPLDKMLIYLPQPQDFALNEQKHAKNASAVNQLIASQLGINESRPDFILLLNNGRYSGLALYFYKKRTNTALPLSTQQSVNALSLLNFCVCFAKSTSEARTAIISYLSRLKNRF